ncbi:MAG: N-glycosylase/DNA lyase [Candidatus Altiarchaeota archaeon]|nr:N-glycosylase/DNA lyase [Candidatus Altiarchaeota archaeon]
MEAKEEPLVVSELKELYKTNREHIRNRLKEFKQMGAESEKRLFAELCFCLCTPQSKAKSVWFNAVKPLMDCGRLYSCSREELTDFLRNTGVRFHRTKAGNIIQAREWFNKKSIKKLLEEENITELRDCLIKNVKGLGMKEASHFLRNTGLGDNIAILDRHILKNLPPLGVIDRIPENLTRKRYLQIEEAMRDFSEKVGIPMDELDLLLWFKETGEVFK